MTVDVQRAALRPPVYLTRFIGRTAELEALWQIVSTAFQPNRPDPPGSRLLTLVGAGGSGKTRLAVELARMLSPHGSDGEMLLADEVYWVDLAPVAEPEQLPQAVAAAIGLPGSSPDPAAVVKNALRDTRALLVLDNCEEMTGACAALAHNLLGGCAALVIMATSRTSLPVKASVEFAVPDLSQARLTAASRPHPSDLSEATELFYDRAGLVAPGYPLLGGDEAAVEKLCQRLDGVPLAIELAAPWTRVLAAQDLLARIDHSLDLLSSTVPELTDRHRSMRAVLDASWRWLAEAERQVLRCLGSFVGGFSLEAAEVVARATLSDLSTLAEGALINRVPESDGSTRYGMHEVIRQYAVERLGDLPDADADRIRERHLDYFVELAESATAAWETKEEPHWLAKLRREEPNAAIAVAWALDQRKSEPALRMCAAMYRLWIYDTPSGQFGDLVGRALALPWDPDSRAVAEARARTLVSAGYAADENCDFPGAARCFKEAIGLYQRLGNEVERAATIRGYSYTLGCMGDHHAAQRYARESLAICRRIENRVGVAWSYKHLAEEAFALDQLGETKRLIAEANSGFEQLGNEFGSYCGHVLLGNVCLLGSSWQEAVNAYGQALALRRRSSFTVNGRAILLGLAAVAVAVRRPEMAGVLYGAARGEAWGGERTDEPSGDHERSLATAQRQLGDAWVDRHEEGCRLTRDQVTGLANEAVVELTAVCTAPPAGLSAREAEVIRLVAEGLSNADIADRMTVSPRTVDAHLRSIFGKLAVSSRTAAVHEAGTLGLL